MRDARIVGGVYGSLVGDALGVPVEFSERAKRDADPVVGMRGWGTWNQCPGTWSDDGALLLCSVEALSDEWDLERMAAGFVAWRKRGHWAAHGEVFDIGGTTAAALDLLATGCPPELAGGQGEETNGNGSLMRILPVALRCAGEDDAMLAERAMVASALTHGHVRSKLACAFFCLLAKRLLAGCPAAEAYREACGGFEVLLARHTDERAAFTRVVGGDLGAIPRAEIRSGGYVIDTLEAAVWCLLRERDFSSTVLAAVNLGGDTDTTGCVAGGLAGCLYGRAAIPAEWVEALPQSKRLAELTESFAAVCARRS